MLTLDEVIKGEYGIVDACESTANTCDLDDPYARNVAYENGKCAEMHKQIAEWLKELKKLKKLACCEDCVSRIDLVNKLEVIDKRYGSDFYWEVRKIVDSLPSVKPVACIGTVKFNKEDMQKIVDDAVKELVLENAR